VLQAQIVAMTAAPPPKKKVKEPKTDDRFKGKWAWKNVKPGAADKQSKEFEGKKYHWCAGHGFWTLHHPSDCTTLHPEKKKEAPPPTKKPLTFAKAAVASMDDDENDDRSHA
jgi:hypothetical protein